MVTARMMAITAGNEDADGLDALRNDPALMIACGSAPETGPARHATREPLWKKLPSYLFTGLSGDIR